MTGEHRLPELVDRIATAVRQVMAQTRPALIEAALSGKYGESANPRHADNFLSVHDLWAHHRYQALLGEQLGSFIYASEEAEPHVIGTDRDPDLIVLVDPLDTSELAVRGLHGYTHVMAYSRALSRPVAAVVGDIFHYLEIYAAGRDADGRDLAFVIPAGANPHLISAREPSRLSGSLVTNYLMRPGERFLPLARQSQLLHQLGQPDSDGRSRGRIGVDFGSVGLCHVATGQTDAMIEFAKGFAIWDLSPGHYVLHAAGGVVLDLSGAPIPLDYGLNSLDDIASAMTRRNKFVAARTAGLAREILAELQL